MTVDPGAAERLRGAAIILGREFSLGEIVEELVAVALPEAVSRLRSRSDATRLRGGGRVKGPGG